MDRNTVPVEMEIMDRNVASLVDTPRITSAERKASDFDGARLTSKLEHSASKGHSNDTKARGY